MARLEWFQADATETSVVVTVWSDTNGTVTVTAGNFSESVSVNTATRFGVNKVDVTGLSGRTGVTVFHSAGITQTGNLRPLPSAGDTWYLGFVSCIQSASPNYWPYSVMEQYDVRMMWFQDDMPYSDSTQQNNTRWQATVAVGGYNGWAAGGAGKRSRCDRRNHRRRGQHGRLGGGLRGAGRRGRTGVPGRAVGAGGGR